MKSAFFAGIALALTAGGLSACGQEQPAAPAASDSPAGVTVTNARLALPPVKGNPGAVYFDIANVGKAGVAIRGADVAGASSAMIHSSEGGEMRDVMLQEVKAGETLKFEPGGRHIMAMGLPDTMQAGGSADVTLHFSRGERLTFPAKILAPGDER